MSPAPNVGGFPPTPSHRPTATSPPAVTWPTFTVTSARDWTFRAGVTTGTITLIKTDWGNGASVTETNPSQVRDIIYAASDCGDITVEATVTLTGGDTVFASRTVSLPACPDTAVPPPVDTESESSGEGEAEGGGRSQAPSAAPVPTKYPRNMPIPTQDYSNLLAGVTVRSDTPWIQLKEVSRAGIGQQSILDRGAISAVDVWGPLGVDAEVCLAGRGSLILLDAAYSPRKEFSLVSFGRDGKTCGHLDRPGTVVLIAGSPTYDIAPEAPAPPLAATATATQSSDPFMIPDNAESALPLQNCDVWSTAILNFRASPAGPIKRWFNGLGTGIARTANWFQIMDQGEIGWISAHYVTTDGDCG